MAVEDLNKIHQRYLARFAGQPRITRDPDELVSLLSEVTALQKSASGAEKKQADEMVDMYNKEIGLIKEARQDGPAAVTAARCLDWMRVSFGRYNRNFAGQARGTRDLKMLEELIEELRYHRGVLATLKGQVKGTLVEDNLAYVDSTLERYTNEIDAIKLARADGTPRDRGARLANLANMQFEKYRRHFASKSRISRRPATLERIIASLEMIEAEMVAANSDVEGHKNNIKIVQQRKGAYSAELQQIRIARAQSKLSDRINALAAAANETFGRYRENFAGKDRKGRDLALLVELLEELYPLAKEMDDIDRLEAQEQNAGNLRLVTDQLRMYDREWDLIREANNPKPA